MPLRSHRSTFVALAVVGAGLVAVTASPASAGTKTTSCRRTCPSSTTDTVAPTISIGAPAAGATVSGSVTVSGSASDATSGVASVDLSVDGGSWQPVSGTTSWSWSWGTTTLVDGSHTLTARSTDGAGNTATTSRTVTVSNPTTPPADTTAPSVGITSPSSGATVAGTVSVTGTAGDNAAVASVAVSVDGGAYATTSGTTSWSWSWASTAVADGNHTLTVRATDTSGLTSSVSRTVSVANTASAPSPAPATQGSWKSPEGVQINVNSAGPWTISGIYSMLTANALDLDKIGPTLTVNVQDSQASYTTTSAGTINGRYTSYVATIWLQGTSSSFANTPDNVLAHEYGHAWSQYGYYIVHNGSWGSYLPSRWTTSDGSLSLATDSRTGSSYSWSINEIVADDYRMLFGTSAAVSERPTHLNTSIPDPRNVTGLRDYLAGAFRTA